MAPPFVWCECHGTRRMPYHHHQRRHHRRTLVRKLLAVCFGCCRSGGVVVVMRCGRRFACQLHTRGTTSNGNGQRQSGNRTYTNTRTHAHEQTHKRTNVRMLGRTSVPGLWAPVTTNQLIRPSRWSEHDRKRHVVGGWWRTCGMRIARLDSKSSGVRWTRPITWSDGKRTRTSAMFRPNPVCVCVCVCVTVRMFVC